MRILGYIRAAAADLAAGIRHYEIWSMLGWAEIRQRYRRSTLGPFWLTISMAATVAGMGPLYGHLLNHDVSSYIAFLAIGMVLWSLISGIVTETAGGFIASEGFIKEFNLPLSVYILRVVWRNLIVFAHNFVVVIIVLLIFTPPLGWSLFLVPIALLAIVFNGVLLGLLLGVFCTRFRDVQQIIASVLQIVFFLTPIMWPAGMLGTRAWALNFNPVYFFVEAARAPLLGTPIDGGIWLKLFISTLFISAFAMIFYGKYRNRIAYWL